MFTTLSHIAIQTFRYRIFGTRTPLVLSLSVTGRCNLRCIYCYSENDNQHGMDVPSQRLIDIIDEFYLLGTRVFMLQGGEPLLHPDIDTVIAHIKSKGAYCAITTNGMYVHKHIKALKLTDQVQLSIDGNQEITDANRGAGVYAALIEAISLCNSNNISFHLHTVLTSSTTAENTLTPLQQLAQEHNTYLNFCIPAKTGSALDRNLASNQQVHELYQSILLQKGLGMPTNNSVHGLREIIFWTAQYSYDSFIRSNDTEQIKRYPKCVMGNLVCWLDSTGMLYPCAIKFGQPGFAYSIHEYGIKGAWKKLQKLPCHYCAGSTEFNNLFRLQPESVFNSLKFLFKRRKEQR